MRRNVPKETHVAHEPQFADPWSKGNSAGGGQKLGLVGLEGFGALEVGGGHGRGRPSIS